MRMTPRPLLPLGLLLAFAPRVDAQASAGPPPIRPEVRTGATAERSVRPDLATVTFSFTAVGPTPLAAGQALSARADSIRRALQALGIPHDSLITGSRWYWWRGRIEMMLGPLQYIPARGAPATRPSIPVQDTTYRAYDAIEVRLHDLRKVGPAIDTALAHGVTDVSGIRFAATNIGAAQEAALEEATRRARRQAQAIAEAGGSHLGRILSLGTEPDRGYGGYPFSGLDGVVITANGSTGGSGTQVIEPQIPVRVTVYGRWELGGDAP